MMAALASRIGLRDSLGAEQTDAVLALAETYAEHVNRSVAMRLVIVDDEDSMASFHLNPNSTRQPFIVMDVIRQIRDELGRRGETLDGVLLIGGDAIFPFWRFGNPVASRLLDPDPLVLTDNPYGLCTDPECLRPTVPVGRICDGGSAERLAAAQVARCSDRVSEGRRAQRGGTERST